MPKSDGSCCLDTEAENDLNLEKNGEEFLFAALFPALTGWHSILKSGSMLSSSYKPVCCCLEKASSAIQRFARKRTSVYQPASSMGKVLFSRMQEQLLLG